MRTSEAENGSGHLSGALPNLRKARVFHRTAGVVLSSAFVALPYLVARVGATLSIALFISTLFAAYYGAFQLVINHDINGAVANKTFRQVVSAAVGRRAGKFSVVVVWQWAAACTSNVALLALAGSFCATLASSACKSLPICQQLSVSSWILIFTFILLVVAAAEPLRKAALWLSALPGFLASLLLLALVITDAFFTSPQVSLCMGIIWLDDSCCVLRHGEMICAGHWQSTV